MLKRFWNLIKSPSSMAIVAIFGVAFGIYQTFFYEKRGEFTIAEDAVSRVFDIYQPVGGLEISYSGQNLRTTKQALWVLTFSVTNTGNSEIRKGDYDTDVPFGVKISGGNIVDVPTKKTTNKYLQDNLKISTINHELILSPVIFEPNDTVQVSTLILGPENSRPSIAAQGKIAGVKSIVRTIEQKTIDKSIYAMVFEADRTIVHFVRIVAYGFLGALGIGALLATVIAAVEGFQSQILKNRRNRQVEFYEKSGTHNQIENLILNIYKKNGIEGLGSLYRAMQLSQKRHEAAAGIEGPNAQMLLDKLYPIAKRTPRAVLDEFLLSKTPPSNENISEYLRTVEAPLKDFVDALKIDLSAWVTRRNEIDEEHLSHLMVRAESAISDPS